MKSKQSEYFTIWQSWLIWNVIGGFVAIGAMAEIPAFFYGFIRSGSPADVTGYSNVLMIILGGISAGATIAATQVKVLHLWLGKENHWMQASILGFGLGFLIVWMLSGAENTAKFAHHAVPHAVDNAGLLGAIIIGASLGTAQWFILRKHFRNAFVWIIANIVGFTIGWQLAVLQPTSDQISHFIGALMVGIALSLTTSIALFQLMKINRKSH